MHDHAEHDHADDDAAAASSDVHASGSDSPGGATAPTDYSADDVKVYLCFDPDQLACAEKLLEFPVVNRDLGAYVGRAAVPVDSPDAEPHKRAIREHLAGANIVLCIISYLTAQSEWVNWELQTARGLNPRPHFVGVLLHEHDEIPSPMRNAGGMFTRFRRQNVAEAIDWVMTEKKTTDDYTQWED